VQQEQQKNQNNKLVIGMVALRTDGKVFGVYTYFVTGAKHDFDGCWNAMKVDIVHNKITDIYGLRNGLINNLVPIRGDRQCKRFFFY
jgi:hypothetical protein